LTLDFITDPLLRPARHGFFTRQGGASSGVFRGLNCGAGSSDQRDIVAINRARVASALGVAPERLVGIHQTHSANVATVDGPPEAPIVADALVTGTPDLALSVLTADCQPVLLVDPEAGVIGAAHAGWRGALAGVMEATVEAMERLGARPAAIRAVIGPTISQRNYEVGPELFEDITIDDPEAQRFFAAGTGDRVQFDLPGYGLHRLRAAGVGEAVWTGHCTYQDEQRFFSYRRSSHRKEADYGRMISAIRL
jgi:purine-nucleoside/S-methyl-5'-thioadenosine phosphorylase / adenosine deaminase